MAKQRISHGATIDTATPSEVAEIIAHATSAQQVVEYRREKGIIQLDGIGAGQTARADLLISAQYDLLLERVTFGGGVGAAGAGIGVYENQVNDVDLLEFVLMPATGKYSDSFANRIFLTANSAVVINVTGGVPFAQVTYNLQGRLIRH